MYLFKKFSRFFCNYQAIFENVSRIFKVAHVSKTIVTIAVTVELVFLNTRLHL